LLLDYESTAPELAHPSIFREAHIIWIFLGLDVLYIIANIFFIRLDKRVNNGNVEHAKLQDIKEGYKSLERQRIDGYQDPLSGTRPVLHVWRVRLYIALLFAVLATTWISFGVALGYRRS
jgi:hypothetical protein